MKAKSRKSYRPHLTDTDRYAIEQYLYDGLNFTEIAKIINKDPTTISKEIRRNLPSLKDPESCTKRNSCMKRHLCGDSYCTLRCCRCEKHKCRLLCEGFDSAVCTKLKDPPYVCNGCRMHGCAREKQRFYRGRSTQREYEHRLVESRRGIDLTRAQLQALDDLVAPLIKQGQPVGHIYSNHADEISVSRKTLYNYIDQGILSVKNIDLRRRVKYKKRKKSKNKEPLEYAYRRGRTYKDFVNYMEEHTGKQVIEMDTVKGSNVAGKCLLTMLFRSSNLMLIFLLERCTQREVIRTFDLITETLRIPLFNKTFPVILTDNGPEFKDSCRLEKTEDGKKRCRVFYCDPSNSNQKARLEKNHEFIRYIIPKGRSMYHLTGETVLLMMNHINSVCRDSLNGHSPFEVAMMLQNKEALEQLGVEKVPTDSINLTPTLLR